MAGQCSRTHLFAQGIVKTTGFHALPISYRIPRASSGNDKAVRGSGTMDDQGALLSSQDVGSSIQ